jgi:hypothetical protein
MLVVKRHHRNQRVGTLPGSSSPATLIVKDPEQVRNRQMDAAFSLKINNQGPRGLLSGDSGGILLPHALAH